MNAEALTSILQEFLSDASGAIVLEDHGIAFDLAQARYSISGEHNNACCTCGRLSETPFGVCWMQR